MERNLASLICVWYGRDVQDLRDTNPWQTWLCEKFQITLPLSNGHTICLNIGLSPEGKAGVNVNSVFVHNHFRDAILGDNTASIAIALDYVGDCNTVAGILAAEIGLLEKTLEHQNTCATILLDALDMQTNENAKQAWNMLCRSLGDYEPRASEVWLPWLESTADMIQF